MEMNKMKTINGYFKYELLDENNKVIQKFEEHNKIMDPVLRMYFEMVTNTASPKPTYADFFIGGVMLGDGAKNQPDGNKAEVTGKETQLEAQTGGYTYMASWDKYDTGTVNITNEGDSIVGWETPFDPANKSKGIGLIISADTKNQKIKFNFLLERNSGNDKGSVTFNEAALFTKFQKDLSKKNPGTIFAMKRFPDVMKSTGCLLKMEWILDFS